MLKVSTKKKRRCWSLTNHCNAGCSTGVKSYLVQFQEFVQSVRSHTDTHHQEGACGLRTRRDRNTPVDIVEAIIFWITPVDYISNRFGACCPSRRSGCISSKTPTPSTAIPPLANLTMTGCEVRQRWDRGICFRRLAAVQPTRRCRQRPDV